MAKDLGTSTNSLDEAPFRGDPKGNIWTGSGEGRRILTFANVGTLRRQGYGGHAATLLHLFRLYLSSHAAVSACNAGIIRVIRHGLHFLNIIPQVALILPFLLYPLYAGAFLALLTSLATPVFAESTDPESLMTAERWSEAETAARAMVEEDAANALGWYFLGRALFERGRPADVRDAASHLSHSVSLDPGLASAWFWLGRASGQLAGAGGLLERIRLARRTREAFERALELAPDNFEYAYALVQFYMRAPAMIGGGEKKAHAVVLEFAGRQPEERMLLEASFALAGTDDLQVSQLLSEVHDMENRLIRRTWREIALQLGRGQLAAQDWKKAAGTYRMITGNFPDDSAGYLGWGRALEEKGDTADARAAYRRCVELAPDSPAAKAAAFRLEATAER